MAFDYNKLRGRIVEKYGSQAAFASVMGWSEKTLSLKLNDKIAWKQPDICRATKLLDLEDADIPVYFFNYEVQSI